MPTQINSDIRASGGDFATITLWQASLGNIVAADENHVGLLFDELYQESIIFSGTTTDPTRDVVLRPAVGELTQPRVVGVGPRVGGEISQTEIQIDVQDSYHTFEDFEVFQSFAGGGASNPTACIGVAGGSGGTGLRVKRMILHDPTGTSSRAAGIDVEDAIDVVILDNFIFDIGVAPASGNSRMITVTTGVSGTTFVYNNSCFNGSDRGISSTVFAAGTHVMETKNNIVLTTGGDNYRYDQTGGTLNTDKNMSSDLTADDNGDGTHFLSESAAAIYVGVGATPDLHLNTGTNAIGNGVDFGSTPAGVEFDIDGYDRDVGAVAWDLGGDQQGLDASDNAPSPDININPVGSPLEPIASGVTGISIPSLGINPVGDALSTIASGAPSFEVGQAIGIFPIGSDLEPLDSGVPVIDIVMSAPVEVNPTGDTLSTIEDNDNVDLINDLQFVFINEGSAFDTLRSGIPQIQGVTSDVTLAVFSTSPEDVIFPLQSGVPLITLPSVGNIDLPVTPGSGLLTIAGDTVPTLQIDTDNPSTPAPTPPGSTFGQILGDGVPIIQIIDTGIDEFPVGSSLGTIASGATKISASFPTAPPGTAGGRLIIRSITRNVTRPVMHETDLEVRVFNA